MKLFVRIDHGFFDNPKIIVLSKAAKADFIEMICYSARGITDGFIDRRTAIAKNWLTSIDELTTNDDINPSLIPTETGWIIHDFCVSQTTSDDIASIREKRSAAGKIGAKKRWEKETTPKTRSTKLSDDWRPNDNARSFAQSNGLDCDSQAAQFKLHAIANDRRQANWDAAFRMWLGNSVKWAKQVR